MAQSLEVLGRARKVIDPQPLARTPSIHLGVGLPVSPLKKFSPPPGIEPAFQGIEPASRRDESDSCQLD